MFILAKVIGIVVLALGLVIFASPSFIQKIFAFFKEGKRIYYAGIIRTFVGLVLLLAASQSVVPLAAIALGLMFIVSGIVAFVAAPEKIKEFIAAYGAMPVLILRLLGLVAASFGMLIFSIF